MGGVAAKLGKKTKKGRGAVTQRYLTCIGTVNSGVDKFYEANKRLEDIVNVLEANVSLATLSESLQEMNFNREKKDSFNQETEQVLLKISPVLKFHLVRSKKP